MNIGAMLFNPRHNVADNQSDARPPFDLIDGAKSRLLVYNQELLDPKLGALAQRLMLQ